MKFTVIPAIDILDQRVVRLSQGRYEAVQYFEKPAEEIAAQFEKEGATRIHLVDLNGAKEGQLVNLNVFQKIRKAVSCELQLGGGIRSLQVADQLFKSGINYLILGSLLIKNPELSQRIILNYPNKIIAGIDLKDNCIATDGWKMLNSPLHTAELLKRLATLPIESIISTDIQKDGMMQGPGLNSLMELAKHTSHSIIASGGVSSLSDILTLKQCSNEGIVGCIIGKALLSGKLSLKTLLKH